MPLIICHYAYYILMCDDNMQKIRGILARIRKNSYLCTWKNLFTK